MPLLLTCKGIIVVVRTKIFRKKFKASQKYCCLYFSIDNTIYALLYSVSGVAPLALATGASLKFIIAGEFAIESGFVFDNKMSLIGC